MKVPSWLYWLRWPPATMDRNPMEACIFLVLFLFTGTNAVGIEPLPGSLAGASTLFGRLCAVGVAGGSLLALVGMVWRNRDDGLVIEQIGLVCAGFGLISYGAAVATITTQANGSFVFGMSFGIALACTIRYFQIQRYIRRRRHGEVENRPGESS